jgi:hypothetical protein
MKYRPVVGLPIVMRPKAEVPRSRQFATIVGIGGRFKLGVHNHSLTNVLRGLTERVYCVEERGNLVPAPAPEPGVFNSMDRFAEQVVGRVGRSGPWTYEQFVASCRGPKRTLYAQAVETLMSHPLRRKDAELATFVKAEKLDFASKPDPAPRLIQPRSPRYNAWVGRYLKSIEHRIYDAIDEVWGMPTVMSGYNALDVARNMRMHWDQWGDTVAVGLDASRFDQHVSVPALRWEHGVYNSIFRDERLAAVLEWQIANRGKAVTPEGVVTYTVEGKRMSGDMNTSLGNKLIMCGLVWTYVRQKGLKVSLVNNGDDCVCFMRRTTLRSFSEGLAEWFLRYGFTMKVESPADEFEKIEFCQQRPVYDGERWIMTRSPYKGLSKDLTMIGINPSDPVKDYRRWAAGVGVAGLRAYGGIPVVQEAYCRLAAMGGAKAVDLDPYSGLGVAAKGMQRSHVEPTAMARASYDAAWGVEPAMQVLVEAQIRGAKVDLSRPYSIELVDHLSVTGL